MFFRIRQNRSVDNQSKQFRVRGNASNHRRAVEKYSFSTTVPLLFFFLASLPAPAADYTSAVDPGRAGFVSILKRNTVSHSSGTCHVLGTRSCISALCSVSAGVIILIHESDERS